MLIRIKTNIWIALFSKHKKNKLKLNSFIYNLKQTGKCSFPPSIPVSFVFGSKRSETIWCNLVLITAIDFLYAQIFKANSCVLSIILGLLRSTVHTSKAANYEREISDE